VYRQIVARYPGAVVVGLSATPARPDGSALGEFWQALECTCPTSQLVSEGHLVSVQTFAPEGTRQRRYGAKPRGLTGGVVENWYRHAAGLPTVLFAGRRSQAREAREAFAAAGVSAEYMDARTPDDERQGIIERVEAGLTTVICQVGLFIEGVDVPCLACCVLLRQCTSRVLFAQAVGRIMRPFPGKERGVLIDHAGAVWRHGLPDEDSEWSLDAAETVDARYKKEKKRKPRPVVCPHCGCWFRGSLECPSCGYVLPSRLRPPRANRPGLLVEVSEVRRDWQVRERAQRLWDECLGQAAHLGRSAGWAAHRYRDRTGHWPDDCLHNVPRGSDAWKRLVAHLYPQYLRGGGEAV
jgi:superfamily II DNA or RNA helicase